MQLCVKKTKVPLHPPPLDLSTTQHNTHIINSLPSVNALRQTYRYAAHVLAYRMHHHIIQPSSRRCRARVQYISQYTACSGVGTLHAYECVAYSRYMLRHLLASLATYYTHTHANVMPPYLRGYNPSF